MIYKLKNVFSNVLKADIKEIYNLYKEMQSENKLQHSLESSAFLQTTNQQTNIKLLLLLNQNLNPTTSFQEQLDWKVNNLD